MAKAKTEGTAIPNTRTASKIDDFQLPDGFTQVNLDIVGFWNEDCVLQCEPLNVKLFDNKVEAIKSSALITCKLLQPIEVRNTDGEIVKAEAGQLIGVWGRPGLKELKIYAGCHVIVIPDGEIEIGKPNPMRAFKIAAKSTDEGKVLPITLDKRQKSKSFETVWANNEEAEALAG